MSEDGRLPFEGFVGYRLRRASLRTLGSLARLLEAYDLRIVEATVLMMVSGRVRCLQSDIARELNIARANLTPLLTRLEQRGIIRREPVDGRSNTVHLTKEGERLTSAVLEAVEEFEEQLLAKLPEELRQNFLDGLDHLS